MEPTMRKSLRVQVSFAFDERIERAVAARRVAVSKPISSKAQAVREAISEWLDRQGA